MTPRSARTILALVLATVAALLPLGSGAGGAGAASYLPSATDVAAQVPVHVPVHVPGHVPGHVFGRIPVDPDGVVGSSGGGDPYFPYDGNGGYDVEHYDIRARWAFADRSLVGTTRLTARALTTLTGFHLDLVMSPVRVSVNGRPARFSKPTTHELRVVPAHPVIAGSRFEVTVTYKGRPAARTYLGESSVVATPGEVAAVGQPHVAPWWFAANDHPQDKARFDITIVVPRGKEVVSNGRLLARRVGPRTTAYHWRARDPMAPYQAYFVAGLFAEEGGFARGLPFRNAVSLRLPPAEQRRAVAALRRTTEVVSWLQQELGAYPFEVTGGVRTSVPLGFSLENQTRPVYHRTPDTRLLVHELAHQWLGNSVGLHRWRDIWLNEGIASWMEWRHREATGVLGAQHQLLRAWSAAPAATWTLPIGDPGPRHLFDWAVYHRGAMTIQALRHRIGEDSFRQLLRGWVALHRNSTVTTADFMTLAGEISGEDLAGFWQAWLRTPRRPERTAANGLV